MQFLIGETSICVNTEAKVKIYITVVRCKWGAKLFVNELININNF